MKVISLFISSLHLFLILLKERNIFLVTFSSPGDLLMVNGVLKKWFEQHNIKPTVLLRTDEFSRHIDSYQQVILTKMQYRWVKKLSPYFSKIKVLNYRELDPSNPNHLMQLMGEKIGLKLNRGDFLPHIVLKEQQTISIPGNYIVIQSNTSTRWTPNKEWGSNKMKEVVQELKKDYYTVQIGPKTDDSVYPDLQLKGKLSFHETAAVIRNAQLFVGMEGALMHASAALGVPSVIVFGGYIHPHQSGYPSVSGLYTQPACAPCMKRDACPNQLLCLQEITPAMVIGKVKEVYKIDPIKKNG